MRRPPTQAQEGRKSSKRKKKGLQKGPPPPVLVKTDKTKGEEDVTGKHQKNKNDSVNVTKKKSFAVLSIHCFQKKHEKIIIIYKTNRRVL